MIVKYLFAVVVIIHGLIHLVGYSRSFHYSEIKNITESVSKPVGLLWMLSCMLFIATAILFLLQKDYWWMLAISAVVLSQVVILTNWKNAKYGSIMNILILLFTFWKII
jgi:hypothetical protein